MERKRERKTERKAGKKEEKRDSVGGRKEGERKCHCILRIVSVNYIDYPGLE